MTDMLRASVILESISVRSPGVGSMWEFTFKTGDATLSPFRQDIHDGRTATFRKTLYVKDIAAKSQPKVMVEVNVIEIDPKRSDPSYGAGMISLDGLFRRQEHASFDAMVVEQGGNRAGAMATLTFKLVSEVREGAACDECKMELNAADPIREEFAMAAANLMAAVGTQLSEAFGSARDAYVRAANDATLARQGWDDAAAQLRTCAQQNAKAVKRTCLRYVDQIANAHARFPSLEQQLMSALDQNEQALAGRYESFQRQDQIELDFALYDAQLNAKCESNLDKIRELYDQANKQLQDEAAVGGGYAQSERQAQKDGTARLLQYQRLMGTRGRYASRLSDCATAPNNFGVCAPLVQSLLVQDAQVAIALLNVASAYQNTVSLLKSFNDQLNQLDDKLELFIENYTDALKEYTACVERQRA